ncbi:MAG: SNF2-related protein [Marinoscillum sp.]
MIYQLVSSDSLDHVISKTTFPAAIEINQAFFSVEVGKQSFEVSITQQNQQTILLCTCAGALDKLCIHQANALSTLVKVEDLEVFFNDQLRHQKIKRIAYDFGLENERNPDLQFRLDFENSNLTISPIDPSLTAVTREHLSELRDSVLSNERNPPSDLYSPDIFIVFKQHKYYKNLQIELYQAEHTKQGKPKNPLKAINTEELIWETVDPHQMKFLMGIRRMENRNSDVFSSMDLTALRSVLHNPLNYQFYYQESTAGSIANSLHPIEIKHLNADITLNVSEWKGIFEITAHLTLSGKDHNVCDFENHFGCFLIISDTWYLIDKLPVISILKMLRKRNGKMIIYESAFKEFKGQFLDKVSDKISVHYQYIKKASAKQLATSEYVNDTEKLIYLSDFGSHVMVIPVLRYSDVEIPVRTKRLVYGTDDKGAEFLVDRDIEKETDLVALLIKQHEDFQEQISNELDHFYLHKRHFLNEDWFLPTFEEWANRGITILGFNEIEGNKLNPNRVKIDIKVLSGLNWFNVDAKVRFGRKRASVKKIQVAVKNKSKYIQLDDGTLGILPQEWLEKFAEYFSAGDLSEDELISIPKINFNEVESLFDAEMLDEEVKSEISTLKDKAHDFSKIQSVKIPDELNGTLRQYQKEGLNWLNFLDDFNFGGCLADDMGLGKSIQIIAFILHLRKKSPQNTNLLVVPTTLIFNWESEFRKFAPSVSILTLQGPDRKRDISDFEKFEVVLLSYNTLLTDVNYLKKFEFNYAFLDESQQIKNPESQRYKATRLLKARNRIAITGTPIENNTFDLYSQFSFACPGLFGNKRNFKDLYAVPIDRFKSTRHAQQLQKKIQPFLLRRTKSEVAKELPKKTEMILFCPMDTEQRNTYDAYEKEFREYISVTAAEELEKSPMHVLKGLTKLRQLCNSTKLLKSDEIVGEKTSSKIEALMEQIENNAPHHKMIIFSQFVSMLELIRDELASRNIGHMLLTGRSKNRESIVNSFRNDEDIRIGLISLKVGGTGLNLVEADYVYLVDPWWNPAVENQAIDRSHRIGQTKNVTAVRLICPDTVEEKILQLQSTKKDLSTGLIKENNSFVKALSKDQLLGLLS